jgi:hypothetical protein
LAIDHDDARLAFIFVQMTDDLDKRGKFPFGGAG